MDTNSLRETPAEHTPGCVLYTIGHSNLEWSEFLELLRTHGIERVVDVRSSPYSRHVPAYNQDRLAAGLPSAEIRYEYCGDALGGRPRDPSCYFSGRIAPPGSDYLHEVDYDAVMKKDWFQKAVNRLIASARVARTAVLCSEADPAACHRHHLIARYVLGAFPDVTVRHIVRNGVFDARQLPFMTAPRPATQPTLFSEE